MRCTFLAGGSAWMSRACSKETGRGIVMRAFYDNEH